LKYTHVFWDWNGTLIDDMECALNAVNSILAKRNKEAITKAQYYEYIDTPIKRFYDHIFDFSDITMEEIMDDFNYFYNYHLSDSPLMNGANSVLKELGNYDVIQIILSSSSNAMLLPYAEKTEVIGYFKHILGSPDGYVNGKIERAVQFIKENKINPRECVLIGDTLHDFDTATAIGCDCILIPNGHQSREDLVATGAVVAEDISHILRLII